MDQIIIQHGSMYFTFRGFCDINLAKITSLVDVAPKYTTFTTNQDKWDPLAAAASLATGTAGPQKLLAQAASAAIVSKWGRRCHVRAHELGLITEEKTMNVRPYALIHTSHQESYDEMLAIRKILNDHKTDFTNQGITAAIITAIDAKLLDYKKVMDLPELTQIQQTDALNKLNDLDTLLMAEATDIFNLLEAEYEDTDPNFVKGLETAFEIGNSTAHRYTGMDGEVKDAQGTPLKGYTIRCTELGKTATTDLLGNYLIKSMKSGLHLFELLDTTGKVIDSKILKIIKGKTITTDWLVP